MEYKFSGKTYDIYLNDSGKIYSPDIDFTAETVDEVKAEIRKRAEKEKALPQVDVFFFGGRWNDHVLIFGKTRLKNVGRYSPEVWISYQEKGKTEREKKSASSVYVATEENKKIAAQISELRKNAKDLERQADDLEDTLEAVKPIDIE